MDYKYLVELHYDAKENELSICRTDDFFFAPAELSDSDYVKKDRGLAMKYLGRFMRRPKSKGYIIVKRIENDGFDRNGIERKKYVPIIMLNVENGAVLVRWWLEEHDRYTSGTAMSPDNGIEKLRETLEIW